MTILAVAGSLSVGLAGCGDDGGDAATTTTSPEEKVSTGAEVVAGLRDVSAMAASIAAGRGDDAAVDALYERWFEVEGTVRATDRDRYLDMEDQLAAVKGGVRDGDDAKVDAAAAALATVIDAYIGAHGETTGTTVARSGKRAPVEADLYDYRIEVDRREVAPGVTTFDLHNEGDVTHEFVVVRTDLDPGALPVDDEGAVDEKGAGITFVDEVEDIAPDGRPTLSVDLEAGRYVLFCNLDDHYRRKMYTALEVG